VFGACQSIGQVVVVVVVVITVVAVVLSLSLSLFQDVRRCTAEAFLIRCTPA
jgi:hypothetical protein